MRLTFDLWGRGYGGGRLEIVHVSRRDVCAPNCYTIDAMECRVAYTYIRLGKLKTRRRVCENHQYICRSDKRLYLHNEACPAADVGILFDLGILEAIKCIL